MKLHIKPMLILFIPAIAVSLYKVMDKVMLGSISSKVELGIYENAEKLVNLPMTIISSFGTVMLPKMSNLVAKNDENISSKYIAISIRYVMCLAFALAFGLAGVGSVFAPFFWGSEFTASGIIIMGLSITLPFMSFANVIRTQYLIPHQMDKDYVASVIIGAFINLFVNWLLIPSYGANGATIGTIAAEVAVCLFQMFVVRKKLSIGQYIKDCIIFLPIGLFMFCIVYSIGGILSNTFGTLLLQIICGIVIYLFFVVIYFFKSKDEFFEDIIKQFLRKINSILK